MLVVIINLMKKSVIWLLVGVMAMTFAALIALQIMYIQSLVKMQTDEFDGAVRRSLSQVVYLLEQDETRRYLENELEERDREALNLRSSITSKIKSVPLPPSKLESIKIDEDPSILNYWKKVRSITSKLNQPQGSLADTFENMQDVLKDRYLHQQALLEDVILRILYESNNLPIAQRVDFNKLEHYLAEEFEKNGLHNVPFHFKVSDKKDQEVYRCNDLFGDHKADYVHVLFPNDPGRIAGKLHLYFPTRAKYIRDPLWVFVPSILFTAVVLAVFAFVIIVIFRQKKLSDMKNDFINNMTHEFKTPISTISLASQMLRDADVGKTPTVMKNISGIIADETKRLSFQVDKVLQVSLFERDKSTLSFKEVDVNKVLRNVVSTFKLKVESIGGQIRDDISEDEALVIADEMHLTDVVFNLLDNALKYRSDQRPLMLEVLSKQVRDHLSIKVKDNGVGIKKEYLKKVFERFYRAPSGNVHNVKGFGLGLAYVKKIINDHKGSITAESELNAGTTFTIHLPLIKK